MLAIRQLRIGAGFLQRPNFGLGQRLVVTDQAEIGLMDVRSVLIDEAAFHDDLPGLIKAAMAMLIWGGFCCR